ncbi:cupin domain-containing protein [bacterium]|nr:cupin domain-containing protein [bacterium]
MKITNFRKEEEYKTAHGVDVKQVYNSEFAQINHIMLEAGEALKPHITPVDALFYVLEGTPTIMIGDERVQVKEDDVIQSPKEIVHCIYNETDSVVRVLVSKLPRPTSPSKFIK